MSKLTLHCTAFRPLRRNTLIGFAVVTITELKLTIRDVAIHQKGDARWAQLPAKAQLKHGALIKDAAGKTRYAPVTEFTTRRVRDAFSAAVIAALREHTPHAFDEAAA